jgi:cytochrome d ubiquinol oxidase subunit I
MNTPVRAEGISPAEFLATASLWDKVFNYSWMPLNLHSLVGNVTFGGSWRLDCGLHVHGLEKGRRARVLRLDGVRRQHDRRRRACCSLPFMGYLLSYELCDYDASICPYMMADQLSMFFEMQGAMIGLIFLASNYYIWLSMKRIEGVERVRMTVIAPIVMVLLPIVMTKVLTDYPVPDATSLAFLLPLLLAPVVLGRFIPLTVSSSTVIKVGFLMVVVGNAIWMTPHGFVPTGAKLVAELELPSDWNFLALMPAKNSAAFTWCSSRSSIM